MALDTSKVDADAAKQQAATEAKQVRAAGRVKNLGLTFDQIPPEEGERLADVFTDIRYGNISGQVKNLFSGVGEAEQSLVHALLSGQLTATVVMAGQKALADQRNGVVNSSAVTPADKELNDAIKAAKELTVKAGEAVSKANDAYDAYVTANMLNRKKCEQAADAAHKEALEASNAVETALEDIEKLVAGRTARPSSPPTAALPPISGTVVVPTPSTTP